MKGLMAAFLLIFRCLFYVKSVLNSRVIYIVIGFIVS